jgi:hypothetical protein
MRVIESTTAERLPVKIETAADPTGAGVEFAVTTGATQPVTWVAGSWLGPASSVAVDGVVRWTARALTPLLGDGQALDLNPGIGYDLWVRWSAAGEVPVRQVLRLQVT